MDKPKSQVNIQKLQDIFSICRICSYDNSSRKIINNLTYGYVCMYVTRNVDTTVVASHDKIKQYNNTIK